MYCIPLFSTFLLLTAGIINAADIVEKSDFGYITPPSHYDQLRQRNQGRAFFTYPIFDANGKKSTPVFIPKAGRIGEIREEFVRSKQLDPAKYDASFSIDGKSLSNDQEYTMDTFSKHKIVGTISKKPQMD